MSGKDADKTRGNTRKTNLPIDGGRRRAHCNNCGDVVPKKKLSPAEIKAARQASRVRLVQQQRALSKAASEASFLTRPIYRYMQQANADLLTKAYNHKIPTEKLAKIGKQIKALEGRAQLAIGKIESYKSNIAKKAAGMVLKFFGKEAAGMAAGPASEIPMTAINAVQTTGEVAGLAGEVSVTAPELYAEARAIVSEYKAVISALSKL
ncbi:MAG: hypothetical protein U0931_28455 [Vulcanimicrobiota bacterium]